MKTMIQQSNNIIFFKEQHIFAIGDREIYVYDSMNFVELEHYSLEESISVMRFSLKGRYIYTAFPFLEIFL